MSSACVITGAITGSLPGKKDNPAVPTSVKAQVESTHEAFEAGAALVRRTASEARSLLRL